MTMPVFKQVMRRITCKKCAWTADYDLLRGEININMVTVRCNRCGAMMFGSIPSELEEYLDNQYREDDNE